ncbi:MAG: cache domain-containing protein [Treponemataceae bacterium]|nr:cache domain-containing protein [Treponemataceae bacterium]
MSDQKKQVRLPLFIFIPVVIFLIFALTAASLLVVDLKLKELTAQNLNALEQQLSTFKISLNYELLKTRTAAEDFAYSLEKEKSPEEILCLFQDGLDADFLFYEDINEKICYSSSGKVDDAARKEIHDFIAQKSGFYGPGSITQYKGSKGKTVFAFSSPVYLNSNVSGFLGNFIYAETIFSKFIQKDEEQKKSFVLCNKDGMILASTENLAGQGFSIYTNIFDSIKSSSDFILKKITANQLKEKTEENPQGLFAFENNQGESFFATYLPVENRDWILFSIASTDDFKNSLLYIIATVWILAAFVLSVCILVYFLRSRIYLTREKLADSRYEHERFLREICCDIYENVIEADISDNLILGKSADKLLEQLNLNKKTSYDEFLDSLIKNVIHPNFSDQVHETLCSKTQKKKYEKG